jgi:trehalose 2-sulfotransferase
VGRRNEFSSRCRIKRWGLQMTSKKQREPVWKDQFLPEQDLVGPAPTVRYVICSTPRSGSHFLGHMMKNTGVFGYPLEYFNPGNLPTWRQRASAEGYESVIRFLEGKRTGRNGRLGIKLHRTHLAAAIEEIGVEALQSDWKFILLRRRDILGQALSWSNAAQTGVWMSGLPAKGEAVYDRQLIMKYMKRICRQGASWREFLAERGLVPLELAYEDVAADPSGALETVSEFLSTPLPRDLDVSRIVTTKVQRANFMEAWRERFIRETKEQSKLASSTEYAEPEVSLMRRAISRTNQGVLRLHRQIRASSRGS